MTPIFEKFQKPHCIEFYNAYDSIRKNIDFHWDFFLFIRDKFLRLPSTEDADKHTMNAFIKFIHTRIYSTHTTLLPQEAIDQRREMYLKIFDFCYKKSFKVENVPSDPQEISKIFNSKKIFKKVRSCRAAVEFLGDKELVPYCVEEFWFIHTFCNFIKKAPENIDFFKRFFGDYPFGNPEIPSEENRLWNEKHSQEFEIIKNDKKESAEDLKSARQWFKEQLKTVKFENLSEEQKSAFFKEMFVAFGNISAAKTGKADGCIVQLRNLFYLGRYYNIHQLPLDYIKNEKKRSELESLAHATWRMLCKLGVPEKEFIEEAIRKGLTKVILPGEESFGKKARRVPVMELRKLLSGNETFDKNDNFEQAIEKIYLNMSIPELSKKTEQELPDFFKDHLQSFLGKDRIANIKKEVEKAGIFERIKNLLKDSKEVLFMMVPSVYIDKPVSISIITHYDIYKNQNKETPSIIEDIAKTILMK